MTSATQTLVPGSPPAFIRLGSDVDEFAFSGSLNLDNELPYADWAVINKWIASLPSKSLQSQAWVACELAWLQHLCDALGDDYQLRVKDDAILLSSLNEKSAIRTLDFMDRSLKRICRLLDGIAVIPEMGRNVMIVLDDDESYYRYISHYYAGEGEFARSGGVYLNAGCGHFVTQKADLNAIEPVAVHEMTHACVAHLPLPVWLNEGMAVNAEQQLTVVPPLSEFTPEILHQKHVAHWNAISIQSFWSGESFLKPGEINLLSYDLARIVVRGLSDDWQRFRKFVLASNDKDAGRAASVSCLEASLGEYVCALLDQAYDPAWEPAALVAENTIADISISWSLKLDETEFKPEQQIYRCSG